MRLLKCLLLRNKCYEKYHAYHFNPVGIVVHSTDLAGKVLKRFVQPYAGQTSGLEDAGQPVTEAQMRAILGKNIYANDWNRPTIGNNALEACVHAFLGQCADGSYAACQTLDYAQPCWGAGSGKNGSYNGCYKGTPKEPLYIQFEMIEDSGADSAHCKALYNLAVEYCAYLCKQFPTIKLENIVSHKEACARGYATNHGDPESFWKRCNTGYTMSKFRSDVQARLTQNTPAPSPDPAPSETLYRVQTGAYKVKANAEALAAQVKAKGFQTYIVLVGDLYKVQTGAFKVKKYAEAERDKLKAAGFNAFVTTKSGNAVAVDNSIKVGDKVQCNPGVKHYHNGATMPEWVRTAILYVRQIEDDGTVYLVSTEPERSIYTGRINAEDVHKV